MDSSTGTVTLEAFADRVGCHFTTASRLRAGERMPSRATLGRIVEVYDLDKEEVLDLFTQGDRQKFGKYLREHVFGASDESGSAPIETGTASHGTSHGSSAA